VLETLALFATHRLLNVGGGMARQGIMQAAHARKQMGGSAKVTLHAAPLEGSTTDAHINT